MREAVNQIVQTENLHIGASEIKHQTRFRSKNEHVPETLSLGKLDPGTLVSGSWASKEIKTRSYFWRTHKDKDSINIDKH